jgi:hypothetical protein
MKHTINPSISHKDNYWQNDEDHNKVFFRQDIILIDMCYLKN